MKIQTLKQANTNLINQALIDSKITVEFALIKKELIAHFAVQSEQAPSVSPQLASDSSQWGLWDWDVVELFLATSDSTVYYEFQVSPLNQFFELEIFEPRKRYNKEFKTGFIHSASKTEKGWTAEMRIPLEKLNWDGRKESLRGNAFAILHQTHGPTHWSLNLPKQEKPDFHLPQYFQPFFSGAGGGGASD